MAPSPSKAALAALETCQGHGEESTCMNLHHDNAKNIQLSLSLRAHELTGKGGEGKRYQEKATCSGTFN